MHLRQVGRTDGDNTMHVLVVTDDPTGIKLAETILTREGHTVITASSLHELQHKAANGHIPATLDVVITDADLGDTLYDGGDVFRFVNNNFRPKSFVLMSAHRREAPEVTRILKFWPLATFIAKPLTWSNIAEAMTATAAVV